MEKIILTLAALAAFTFAFDSQAQAAGRGGSGGGGHSGHAAGGNHGGNSNHGNFSSSSRSANFGNANRSVNNRNYNLSHGTHFSHGYYYRGRNHSHWSSWQYDGRYGCNIYYDQDCGSWYYWCEQDDCYYPVSYCPYGTYN